jgi:hypothetical protein
MSEKIKRTNQNQNQKNKKREENRSEAVDRNGRFQIQGGKKLDFTEINQGKQILLGLSLVGNLVKPLLSLYRNEWRERGY